VGAGRPDPAAGADGSAAGVPADLPAGARIAGHR
jgi:hypothetical protein